MRTTQQIQIRLRRCLTDPVPYDPRLGSIGSKIGVRCGDMTIGVSERKVGATMVAKQKRTATKNSGSKRQGLTIRDLFMAYKQAGTRPTQSKYLARIIDHVAQDPEGAAAKVLAQIARKGDALCAKAIEPLLDAFWKGDHEWQEATVGLLSEIAHLAPLPQRVRVGQFLGHVAVSEEFVGGSGVDGAAVTALAQIAETSGAAFRKKLPKGKLRIRKEDDARRAFEAEIAR